VLLDLRDAVERRVLHDHLEVITAAGAVDDLGLPGAFQIALLNRRQRRIHDDQSDFALFDQIFELFDLAGT